MIRALFTCTGGSIVLPDARLPLVSRLDGGNLIVNPPRVVWERSELSAAELTRWSFLVAATGTAMLGTLPQLDGGCINYWEAGNWSLNDEAEPRGPKTARERRQVHMHLLGRSRTATAPSHRWGEAPMFPPFRDRYAWASSFETLTADECCRIVEIAARALVDTYGVDATELSPWASCTACGYPVPGARPDRDRVCAFCAGPA